MVYGRCLRPALYSSLRSSPSHPSGVSALRVTIAIASARKQWGLRELAARSRWLFREPATRRPRRQDGEIKGARRSNRKPLTWLGFRRAGRSGRVPRLGFLRMRSTTFSALYAFWRPSRRSHDHGRQRSAYPARAHPQYPRAEAEELHQSGATRGEENRTHLGSDRRPAGVPRPMGVRPSAAGASPSAGRRLFSPTRRVVVKARVVRHKGRAFRSAPLTAHLSYLKREGVTRDGEKARDVRRRRRPRR